MTVLTLVYTYLYFEISTNKVLALNKQKEKFESPRVCRAFFPADTYMHIQNFQVSTQKSPNNKY